MAKTIRENKPPEEKHYSRFTRYERNDIERMLDRNKMLRAIAKELRKAPSTVAHEITRHRFITAPRARYGEHAPKDLNV